MMTAMTALAHRPAAFEIRGLRESAGRRAPAGRVRLRATGDGWALVGTGGEVLFSALGQSGRRECLRAARRLGAVTVFS